MIQDRIDVGILERFEAGLNPARPDESTIPARIIGYGEISTIFEILESSQQGLAYKRLPIFYTKDEMDQYEPLFMEYNRVLRHEIGIPVPDHASIRILPQRGNLVIYNVQEKLPPESIGNQIIHRSDDESVGMLLECILEKLLDVFSYNQKGDRITLGIDGQISNWAVKGFSASSPVVTRGCELIYFDTSTPLMRINGKEQINPDLFLRSAPSFLVWIIKLLFLNDVLTRYYDFRLVVIDLIANLFKEQRKDLIPAFIDRANGFFSTHAASFDISPITLKEIRAYYREDAMIWRLYLALRRLDRFLTTTVRKKPYVYILPGKITR
ncbi:MAG: DUF6206 family protein [Desulfomonilia bacterium]